MKKAIILWFAQRTAAKARNLRRRLRDLVREETAVIVATEKRERGLRLYLAWMGGQKSPRPEIVTGAWTRTPRRKLSDIVLVRKEAA